MSRCRVQVPCPGAVSRCRVQVPCPGAVSRCRVQVPCPGAVSRCRVQVPCPGAVSRCRVQVSCPGAMARCRVQVPWPGAMARCRGQELGSSLVNSRPPYTAATILMHRRVSLSLLDATHLITNYRGRPHSVCVYVCEGRGGEIQALSICNTIEYHALYHLYHTMDN